MISWRFWISAALLLFACQRPLSIRASIPPPRTYVFEFVCDKAELDDERRDRALHNLEPKIAESVSGVEVKAAVQMTDSDRKRIQEAGGEVLEIEFEKSGDDRLMNLKVLSRLHPAKPYPVMKGKTKSSAGDMVSLSVNLQKLARTVQQHHVACHLEGACK